MSSRDAEALVGLLREVKNLAKRYYDLTGRPLGVTGEVAEFEAIRILKLEPAPVRQVGYDATRNSRGHRDLIQIKGRYFPYGVKPSNKIGRIDVGKPCDYVLLVLLDADFNATAIFRAAWDSVRAALVKPGSKGRNERGQLSVAKFKSIGSQMWPRAC